MNVMVKQENAKVTIYDVAREAGVSKTSVSRYLGGRYDELSDKTRKKIELAINKMEYRPNTMARGLKSNKSYLIGIIVADINNPYTTAILRGAEDICSQNGYNLMICNSDNNPEKERGYFDMLLSHRIDGLIIHTTGGNHDMLKQMQEQKTPIILLDRKVPNLEIDTVGLDNFQATSQAVNYLVGQNYERIAFFSEPASKVSTRYERRLSFQQTLMSHSHPSSGDVYEVNVDDLKDVESKLQHFLDDSKGVSRAILTANSVVLLKLILLLQEKKLSVPEDLAMMGFDNPDWSTIVYSGITTIEQPTYQIGVAAMEMILHRIDGQASPAQTMAYQAKLNIRQTTPFIQK
jgi:LacI family transcriptional regulator, kdg operon repressor